MPTRSYQSQSQLAVHFGLGEAETVDSVRVVWPDGTEQPVDPPAVNQTLVVERGQ